MALPAPAAAVATLDCGGKPLDLSTPRIMGVLNMTPDSFSDGGAYYCDGKLNLDLALLRVEAMLREGASIIDIGGESTRPGATPVSLQQELDRVIPIVAAIATRLPAIISVDTSSPEVMMEAAKAGVGMINDVRALMRPGAITTAASLELPVCLMHTPAEPDVMQQEAAYGDVVGEVFAYLRQRADHCQAAGVTRRQLLLDPGFGFGKKLHHNLKLLHHLDRLVALGYPVLVGFSRKSMIGQLLGTPADQRLFGSVAAAAVAVLKGAAIVRCHDVGATLDAIKVAGAVLRPERWESDEGAKSC